MCFHCRKERFSSLAWKASKLAGVGGEIFFSSEVISKGERGFSFGSLEGKNFERVSSGMFVVISWTILTYPSVFFLSYILSSCLYFSDYWLIAWV